MKKAIAAVFSVIIAVTVFAGCQKKVYLDTEKYEKAVSEQNRKESEALSEQESKIEEDKAKLEEEIGKSVKGEKLVVKQIVGEHTDYFVYNFKKNKRESLVTYKYYTSDMNYELAKKDGDIGSDKLIDSDDKLRCLVYKDSGAVDLDYDYYYTLFSRRSSDYSTIVE